MRAAPLVIIHQAEENSPRGDEEVVSLKADRATLAKRRWRGVAEDGREFGFDLHHVLAHGKAFFREAGRCYVVLQAPESVVEIELGREPARAAALAWQIGNLHLPIEVTDSLIRCADDLAVLQMAQREQIAYRRTTAVFRPLSSTGHAHHH